MAIFDTIDAAATRHGVDPNSLRTIAKIESGFDPSAQNPRSSAGGLFQFIDSTAADYGLQDRFDPAQAADAGARLARDNSKRLSSVLGRDPSAGELYLAHQQGAGGASKLLRSPNARAVDIVGAAAVKLNGGRTDMSAQEFANIWIDKANKIAGTPQTLPADNVVAAADTSEARIHKLFAEGNISDENKALYIARYGDPSSQQSPQAQQAETPENRIHRFYREGLLSQENQAKYIARFGVPNQAGNVQQPAEAAEAAEPATPAQQPALPPSVLDAYNAGNLNPANMQRVADFLVTQQPAPAPAAPAEVQPVNTQPEAPETQQEPQRGFGGEMLRQLGLTARAGIEGGAGLLGLAADPIAALLNQGLSDENQIPALRQNVSALLTDAGVPEPETVTERIVQAASEAIVSGAGTVAAARGAGAVLTGGARAIAGSLAQAPAAQIVSSGVSGASGQTAAEAGAGPVGQIAASLAGGVLGARVANRPIVDAEATAALSSEARRTIAAGEGAGVRTLTSDVVRPESFTAKTVQRVGERIPLAGTGSVRAAQQSERVAAVKDIGRVYGAKNLDDVAADIVDDIFKQRGAVVAKNSKAIKKVLANAPGSVPLPKTTSAIDAAITKQKAIGTDSALAVVPRLENWKINLVDKGLDGVDEIRREMGAVFSDINLPNAVRSSGQKAVNSLYGSIKADMGDHIKAVGKSNDFTKWEVANANLVRNFKDADRSTLKAVLRSGKGTPEVISRMLLSGKKSDNIALFKTLSLAGRKRAQSAIIGEAIRRDGVDVSPDVFLQRITKMSGPVGVFFRGRDRKVIEGLSVALRATKRAADAALAPPTGVQAAQVTGALGLGGAGALAGGAPGIVAAGAGAGLTGLSARAYESAPIRNLLISLTKVKRGSPEEVKLLKRIIAANQTAEQRQDEQK